MGWDLGSDCASSRVLSILTTTVVIFRTHPFHFCSNFAENSRKVQVGNHQGMAFSERNSYFTNRGVGKN